MCTSADTSTPSHPSTVPLAVPLALGVGAVALDVTHRARWSAGEEVSALLVFGARAPTHPFPPSPIPPAVEAETPGVQACGPGGSQVSSLRCRLWLECWLPRGSGITVVFCWHLEMKSLPSEIPITMSVVL